MWNIRNKSIQFGFQTAIKTLLFPILTEVSAVPVHSSTECYQGRLTYHCLPIEKNIVRSFPLSLLFYVQSMMMRFLYFVSLTWLVLEHINYKPILMYFTTYFMIWLAKWHDTLYLEWDLMVFWYRYLLCCSTLYVFKENTLNLSNFW